MTKTSTYAMAIVGGGINGLCAAYSAAERGIDSVILIDRFRIGHDRGSSHGQSRITRTAYANSDYVRLMQVSHDREWPAIEKAVGSKLIYHVPGCFFGPGPKYAQYSDAISRQDVNCTEISVPEAKKMYPQFAFPDTPAVLLDKTGGLIAARDAVLGLREYLSGRITIAEGVTIESIDLGGSRIRLDSASDTIEAESVIVTAGPWAKQLCPILEDRLTVARQIVSYVTLDMPAEAHTIGAFPVWGYLGGGQSVGYYGLPEYGRPGIKVAKHVTSGRDDSPDDPRPPAEEEIEDLKAFVDRCFTPSLVEIVGLETCHYTNTVSEDFIIDRHPDNPFCVIGAGFSGHGFKLGPITGRALVDLALDRSPGCDVFRDVQDRFSIGGRG